MRKYIIAFKQWLADLFEQMDDNRYVVSIWNGEHWQVIVDDIKSKREAYAAYHLHAFKMNIQPEYMGVFTQRIATKTGMYK